MTKRPAAYFGAMLLAPALALPAMAEPIVLEDLNATQQHNLLLTIVRVEVAKANCEGIELTDAEGGIFDPKIETLAALLEYDETQLNEQIIGRAQSLYEADTITFCDTWAPQVRPVAVALLE